MRRISRLERSIGLPQARVSINQASPFLCAACRQQKSFFSVHARTAADKKQSLGDYFRKSFGKKIWAADAPGIPDDPYTGESQVSRRRATSDDVEPVVEKRPYEPATDWTGLDVVGDEKPAIEEYIRNNPFQGFIPKEALTSSEDIAAALRRAIVEVTALRQAGLLLTEPASIHDRLSRGNLELQLRISQAEPEELEELEDIQEEILAQLQYDPTTSVQLRASNEGGILEFPESTSLDEFIQEITATEPSDETAEKSDPTESEEDVAADRSEVDPLEQDLEQKREFDETAEKEDPTEAEEEVAADRSEVDPLQPKASASWDPSWTQISLQDPEIKFAVLKRTMQLTGIRPNDSLIRNANTAQSLLSHFITPPKAKKLTEALVQKEGLLDLPNVTVWEKRITTRDKEMEVGRWKVIDKELKERGLDYKPREPKLL